MDSGKLLTDKVADDIVRTIIGRELKPGDKLPNEFELASKLGVGRSTVREAIKILVSRNVVEIRRGAGTFVSAHSGVSEDPLGLQFLDDCIRVATDLLQLRFLIEPRVFFFFSFGVACCGKQHAGTDCRADAVVRCM